jgi:hypothetical protein
MRWINGELINVTEAIQQNNIIRQRLDEFIYRCTSCKKLFSCVEGWKKHKEWMVLCGKISCVCDVFSYGKYSYSISESSKNYQRSIETKELKKLEDGITLTAAKPELI